MRHPVYTAPTKSMFMEETIFSACKALGTTILTHPGMESLSAYSAYELLEQLNRQLSAYRSFNSVHGFKDKNGDLIYGNAGGFDVKVFNEGEWFATISLDSSYCSHVAAGQYITGCLVNRDRQGKVTAESSVTTPQVEGGGLIETVRVSDQHLIPGLLRQLFPTAVVDSVNGCGFLATNISIPTKIDGLELFRLHSNGLLAKTGRLLRIPGYSIAEEASEMANAMMQQALNSPETSMALTDAIQRFAAVQKEIATQNYIKTDASVDEALVSMLALKNAAAFFTSGPHITEARQLDIINRTALKAVQSAGTSRFCLEDQNMQRFYLSGLNTLAELHSKNHQILDPDTRRPIGQFDGSRWRSTPMMVTGTTYGEKTKNGKYVVGLGSPSALQLIGYTNMAEDNATAVKALADERARIEQEIQLANPKKIASDIEKAETAVERAYNRFSDSLVNQGIATAASKAILEQIAKIMAYPVMIGPWARPLGCIGDYLQITDNYRSVTTDYAKMRKTVFQGYNTSASWFCFKIWRTCEGDSSACSASFWGGGSRQKLVPITLDTPTKLGTRYMRIDRQSLRNMGLPVEYAQWVTNWVSRKQTISQVFKRKTVVPNCTYSYWGAEPSVILENFKSYITTLLPALQLVAAAKATVDAGIENIKTLELARAHAVAVQSEYDVLLTRLGSIKAQQAYYESLSDIDWSQVKGVYFEREELPEGHTLATNFRGTMDAKVGLGMQALDIRSKITTQFSEAVKNYKACRERKITASAKVAELQQNKTETDQGELKKKAEQELKAATSELTSAIKLLLKASRSLDIECNNIPGFAVTGSSLKVTPNDSLSIGLGRTVSDGQFTANPAKDGALAVALSRGELGAQKPDSKEWLFTRLNFERFNFTIPIAVRLEEKEVAPGLDTRLENVDEETELDENALLDIMQPFNLVIIPLGLEYTSVAEVRNYSITMPGYVLPLTTLIALIHSVVGTESLSEEHLASVISCLDRCDVEDLKTALEDSPLTEREKVVLDSMLNKAYGEDDETEDEGEKAFKAVISSADNMAFLPFIALDSSFSGYARLWAKIASSVSLSTIVPKYEYQAFDSEKKQFVGEKTLVDNAAASHTIVRRLACELEK